MYWNFKNGKAFLILMNKNVFAIIFIMFLFNILINVCHSNSNTQFQLLFLD